MDFDSLHASLQHGGLGALGVGFLAGFLFSFKPVALAAIPVSLAYVTMARGPRDAIVFGALFIAGMLVTHALLGTISGLGGRGCNSCSAAQFPSFWGRRPWGGSNI